MNPPSGSSFPDNITITVTSLGELIIAQEKPNSIPGYISLDKIIFHKFIGIHTDIFVSLPSNRLIRVGKHSDIINGGER